MRNLKFKRMGKNSLKYEYIRNWETKHVNDWNGCTIVVTSHRSVYYTYKY